MRGLTTAILVLAIACGSDGSGQEADGSVTDGQGSGDATPVDREDVQFQSDVTLTGYLAVAEGTEEGAPGVLLIHQFQRDDTQWGDWPDALAGRGYRVLAFNLRGHGDSDDYAGDLVDLLSDPAAAPADMDAALAYLTAAGGADPERIAVVGTSIGANLAVSAAIRDLARTYVSLSSRLEPSENFAGSTATGMQSVFYLAGENDGGDQAGDGQTMFDATSDPRQIEIYEDTADHGIAILDRQPDARGLIEAWLESTL